jgi:TatD DNase family protein
VIDTHAHIDVKAFDEDREAMLDRARAAGVTAIIVPDIERSRRAHLKEVVDAHPDLYRGVGIHPHHAGEMTQLDLEEIAAQCTEPKVVAIGEIGLDYYYDFCPPDVQKLYFREQIRIAKARNLPIIVHNRESDSDVMEILREEQDGSLRGVLHCFSSDVAVLDQAMDLGLHVSFTGNITFKKTTLNDVLLRVPLDRVMIETDAPYMTPVPHRGTRNEPSYVRLVAEKLAEIKGMPLSEIIATTTATARRFFGLLTAVVLCTLATTAQPTRPNEDDYENDTDLEIALENYEIDSIGWAKYVKPRSLGIGLTLGSNTVVEQRTKRQEYTRAVMSNGTIVEPQVWTEYEMDKGPSYSFSYDGLASIGGTLMYQLTTRIALEGTYIYTQNVGDRALYGLAPIETSVAEATMLYSLNPYNKVNFVPQIGATFVMQSDGVTSTSQTGINTGIGLGVNIPTSFGLFYPMVNVRFNFMFGTQREVVTNSFPFIRGQEDDTYISEDPNRPDVFLHYNPANPSQVSVNKADVTTIYSIPRLTLMFFPKF